MPSPNYKEYNNFRSGDLSPPDGKKTPDAALKVPEACVVECAQGSLILWVHVGNEGSSPLTAPGTLTVTGIVNGQEAQLGNIDLVEVIDIGEYSDAFEFQIDPTDLESLKIVVSPKEQECDLANNEIVLQGPFCQ